MMWRMGIEALYRRPRTTKPETETQDLPVLATRARDHATQSGLSDGHHVHPDGQGLVYLAVVAG